MSYKVINIHPEMTDEERERVDREATEKLYRIFKEHDERIAREKALAKSNGIS